MKDPLLLTYTFEELMYEFHSMREHDKAAGERAEQENDKIEEAKDKAAQDWVDQMEAEEAANDPMKDPANIKWMEEQMALDKEMFGEDFGKDLSLDFNSPNKIDEE
jgi:hypothetical protein